MTLFIDALLTDGPDAPALAWPGGALSRAQMLGHVTRLAGWMQAQGVTPGARVALCLPKGPCAVIGVFAALACGAVAVPLDPAASDARVALMLADLDPRLVVVPAELAARLGLEGALTPDPQDPATLPQGAPLHSRVAPQDPALILMTSGSTGRPKGVVLSHRAITTFIDWAIATFDLRADDSFLSIAPLHFDLSLLDVYASLRVGARVYLLPERKAAFPQEILSVLQSEAVSVLYTVPTLLRLFAGLRVFDRARPVPLRWLLSAGEVLPAATLRALAASLPDCRFANLYGPTETNVIACHLIDAVNPDWIDVPIGTPCDHCEITIRDADGRVLPQGETGEICARGPSVMSGYWQHEDLTLAARIGGDAASYRTGDFGRIEADGTLTFLGRRDAQVKIRGYRIELGEIEGAALDTGLIALAAAVPLVASDGTARLVLAVVAPGADEGVLAPLRAALAARLPPQSRPERIVLLSELPQTSTGKTDRTVLLHRLGGAQG